MNNPQSKQRWTLISDNNKNDNVYWTIVTIKITEQNAHVHLTGPGPCRGYKVVEFNEFLRNWEICT